MNILYYYFALSYFITLFRYFVLSCMRYVKMLPPPFNKK